MHESVARAIQQISERGGQLTAEALSNIFRQFDQPFGEDFNPNGMLREVWNRMFGERTRRDRFDDEPMVVQQGVGMAAHGGFNVIPAPPGPGGCAKLCVTFADQVSSGAFRGLGYPLSGRASAIHESMLLQAKYWLDCHSINEENLILVTHWDQQRFEFNIKNLVDGYMKGYSKKVFIVEVTHSGPFLRYPY